MEWFATLNWQVCELARQAGEDIMGFYQPGLAIAYRGAEKLSSMPGCSHGFCVLLQLRWQIY